MFIYKSVVHEGMFYLDDGNEDHNIFYLTREEVEEIRDEMNKLLGESKVEE